MHLRYAFVVIPAIILMMALLTAQVYVCEISTHFDSTLILGLLTYSQPRGCVPRTVTS